MKKNKGGSKVGGKKLKETRDGKWDGDKEGAGGRRRKEAKDGVRKSEKEKEEEAK